MKRESGCERLLEIDLGHAEGREPSGEELAFCEEHLATCPDCRAEREVLSALDGPDNTSPMTQFDDVARRRFVDDLLAKADASDRTAISPRPSRARIAVVAVVAAVAAAAAVAIVLWARPDTHAPAPGAETAPSLSPARVLLASGQVTASGTNATVGDVVAPGTQLATGSGELWIGLPTDFTVALGPETRAVVRRLDRDALILGLESGRLLISAVPGRKGPRLSVSTRAGTVTVKGTVLTIEDRPDAVEVLVARGSVEIEDGAAAKGRRLGPSEAIALGGKAARPTQPEEDADLLKSAAAFDLLDPGVSALVDLRSVPSGAAAVIDGASLGRTPLVAAVRAGHRRLEISLDGRLPVSELVDVSPGTTLARIIELQPAMATFEDAASTDSTGSGTAGKTIRPSAGSTKSVSATDLLHKAQERRAERDFKGAAAAYKELLSRYPESDEARSAVVSLGQIELDRLGEPAAALRHFNAYLDAKSAGPLGMEALYGRARALKTMGRVVEERASLELFLKRYPDAIQTGDARRRLEQIAASEKVSPGEK
jgi:ferric-dicitrate binding protein FerR (iron transport regulator)/tetratricopeptide (TPR) repeat protein